MKEIRTEGNFMVYGPQGERRAAFALESDKRLFEAAPDLLAALEDLVSNTIPDDGIVCTFCGRVLDGYPCTSDDCMGVQARAAIAKAQGG